MFGHGKKRPDSYIKVRNSRKCYIPFYLMVVLLVGILVTIAAMGKPISLLGLGGSAIFILAAIKSTEVHRLMNSYEITKKYIIHNKGLFAVSEKSIFIPTISDIIVDQSSWERILNYGTVNIHRYSDGSKVEAKKIANPKKFAEILQQRLNEEF